MNLGYSNQKVHVIVGHQIGSTWLDVHCQKNDLGYDVF